MAKYKVTIELMNGAIRGNTLEHVFDLPDDDYYYDEDYFDIDSQESDAEALGDDYVFQHVAWTTERID